MGGGVIRAAAKVAGFTVPAGDAAVSSVVRRTASLRTAASTQDDVKLVASNADDTVRRRSFSSSSYVDDWELAGGEDDVGFYAGDSMPRVVFGGVPSLKEAQEATSELSVAIEKAFLWSPSPAESVASVDVDYDYGPIVEAKPFVGSEIAPAVSSSTMMAFKMFKESPVAQTVVASIASDPNVWNAVLQNEELQGFLKSQGTCVESSGVNFGEVAADSSMDGQSSKEVPWTSSENGQSGHPKGKIMDTLEKIKSAVVDMMTGLSDFFVNMFGGKAPASSDGNSGFGTEAVVQGSLIGFAIMAILVILLKRV